jgi:antitoxin HicB
MISYPVRLTPGEEGMVLVTFPDVPEAVACGRDEDEAIARAASVLELILGCYASEGRPIPQPSEICGAPAIVTHEFSR